MSTPHQNYDAAINLKNAGDLDGAIALLKENAVQHPEHADTHAALAVYLQRQGNFDDAISHAKKVCEILPNDPFSYTQLSVIYVKCGKIPEAEEAKARAHMAQAGGAIR
ncbi:tetratricopeptide repeat protein [Planctomicrobium sp. SH668]|uniref:tetratricopeptide repeat protein n=1 Tax=Planctomicrobium sp. SH668 TaxID=3448126 RepID=UPI003F5C7AAC